MWLYKGVQRSGVAGTVRPLSVGDARVTSHMDISFHQHLARTPTPCMAVHVTIACERALDHVSNSELRVPRSVSD